jgi:hypothetical protein
VDFFPRSAPATATGGEQRIICHQTNAQTPEAIARRPIDAKSE